jgi:aminoglycoside phosphotransferase (APT) family kinase protein
MTPPRDSSATAVTLGRFLRALHQAAPEAAPRNQWRGVPLATRDKAVRQHVEQLGGLIERGVVLDLWERAVSAPPWPGPPLWIHGDLHPGNLLVSDGRLSAVIDFGDLTAGDPATDLSVLWMLFPPSARPEFLASTRGESDPLDEHTVTRARGWALALGLAYLANSRGDETMSALGRATIDSVMRDNSE